VRSQCFDRRAITKTKSKFHVSGTVAASKRVSKTRQVNFFLDLCREQSYI
jgi:hypothetical protein